MLMMIDLRQWPLADFEEHYENTFAEPLINRIGDDLIKPGEIIPVQDFPQDVGDCLKALMSDWFNPKNFYIQLLPKVRKLKKLMSKLNRFYSDPDLDADSYTVEFLPGVLYLYVAALYYNNKEMKFEGWHRAMIERLEDDEFVKVFYVDYGTRAIIPLKNCRYLHKCFAEMPCQAINAKCGGIKPKKLETAEDKKDQNKDENGKKEENDKKDEKDKNDKLSEEEKKKDDIEEIIAQIKQNQEEDDKDEDDEKPEKWLPEAIHLFYNLIIPTISAKSPRERGIIAQIMKKTPNKKLQVILYDTVSNKKVNGININDRLIKSGFAIKDEKWLISKLLPWERAQKVWDQRQQRRRIESELDQNLDLALANLNESLETATAKIENWCPKNTVSSRPSSKLSSKPSSSNSGSKPDKTIVLPKGNGINSTIKIVRSKTAGYKPTQIVRPSRKPNTPTIDESDETESLGTNP